MFLILRGPERWFCETETSSPVITFLFIHKRVVSDEKYCILFVKRRYFRNAKGYSYMGRGINERLFFFKIIRKTREA